MTSCLRGTRRAMDSLLSACLIPKKIRQLYKHLPTVIDERISGAQQAIGRRSQRTINVLQITVVANVNRRPRMQHVGKQHVTVELPGVLQGGERRVGNGSDVLADQPQREFLGE